MADIEAQVAVVRLSFSPTLDFFTGAFTN